MKKLEKAIVISMLVSSVLPSVGMCAAKEITAPGDYVLTDGTYTQATTGKAALEISNSVAGDVNIELVPVVAGAPFSMSTPFNNGTCIGSYGGGNTTITGADLSFLTNISGNKYNAINNSGILTIDNNMTIYGGGVANQIGGTVNLNGKIFVYNTTDSSVYAIENAGTMNLQGDELNTYCGPISNSAGGNLTINCKTVDVRGDIINEGNLSIQTDRLAPVHDYGSLMNILGNIYHQPGANTDINIKGRTDTNSASAFCGTIYGSDENFKLTLQENSLWVVSAAQEAIPVTGVVLDGEGASIAVNPNNTVFQPDGTVHWQNSFQRLTLKDFKIGPKGGSLLISTDLANNVGDKVTFTGTTPAAVNIGITDKNNNNGAPIKREEGHSVTIVSAPLDTGLSIGAAGTSININDNRVYQPIIDEEMTASSKNWNLVGWEALGSVDLKRHLNIDEINPHLTIQELEAPEKRLLDLRNDPSEVGAWIRGEVGKNKIGSYNYSYNIMSGGYDFARENKKANIFFGLGLNYTKNNCDTGIIGDTKSIGVTLYGSWLGKKNHDYVDVILKRGKINKDYAGYDKYGIYVSGDYDKDVTSFSTRYGRRFIKKGNWYIEPSVGFTYGVVDGAEFVDSTGVYIKSDSIDSEIASLGIQVGKNVKGTDYYGKVQLMHDFGGKMKVTAPVTGDYVEDDMGGTWTKLTLGASRKINSRNSFYIDLGKDFGNKVEKPWSISAGYRYTW